MFCLIVNVGWSRNPQGKSNFIKTRSTEFRLVYLEIQKMCKKLLQVKKASQMEQLLIVLRESWSDHQVF